MNNELMALELTKIFYSDRNIGVYPSTIFDRYTYYLKELDKYHENTIVGEIKELLYKYYQRNSYSEFEKGELISNIEKIINKESE